MIVEVSGHRVHYVEKGNGPPLVLIHGASGNLRDWTYRAVDQLSRRYRVIAFDRPGMGYTPRIDSDGASIFEQAALLSAASRQLGAERPIVLGHSYGGAVALAWAASTRFLKLLSSDSSPKFRPYIIAISARFTSISSIQASTCQ